MMVFSEDHAIDFRPYLDRLIYVADAQELGFCVVGQRKFWRSLLLENEKEWKGVTFESFLEQGVTVRWLLETGNPYALRLVEHMIKRWQ